MIPDFKKEPAAYAVGRRVNSEEWNAVTLTAEGADDAARIPFGAPVVDGTGRKTGALASANGQTFRGISETDVTLPRPGDAGYARYDEMAVLEWGVIAVATEGNTTRGGQARWNSATKKWTAAAQSATVFTIPGAVFEFTATAPSIAPVRLRKVAAPSLIVAS